MIKTAYNHNFLGLPLIPKLNQSFDFLEMKKFQREITPGEVIISASGVGSHKEFIGLVKRNIAKIKGFGEYGQLEKIE